MSNDESGTWHPQAVHLSTALVLSLAQALNLDNYDALHAFSLSHPADYWKAAIDFLNIRWSKTPDSYVDLSRGSEFPNWFPGGELNWVDTVLAYGAPETEAEGRTSIIAEREDGKSQAITFGELRVRVRRFAAGLQRLGLKRGDRVGLFMESGVEASVSVLALSYLGCVVVPLFSGFGVDAIVSRLQPSGARALITTTGFNRRGRFVEAIPTVQEALKRLSTIELVIWKPGYEVAPPERSTLWSEVAETPDSQAPAARMASNDPFMIIYTSGTTGKPKGIVHTHGSFPLKIAHDSAIHFNVRAGDVFCWPADMGWVAGPLVMCSALMRGATLVCYDGAPDFPNWSRMSRVIERYRVTHYGSAPTLIRGLAANETVALEGDRSSVKLLITAGEGIDPDHFTWFRTHFAQPGSPLINYTGGTEVSGGLLSSVIVKPIKAAGFNTSSPAVDVDVVSLNGRSVVGEVGELAIRSPFVGMTRSFWQDDERYLETYWQRVPGTWIHGDLALRTPAGDFFMLGRSDDTIKLAGKRLGPAEVEEVVLELEPVSEAAAIGVDDPAKGQRLVIFVVSSSVHEPASEQSVKEHVEHRLGRAFRPSAVYTVAQLPKTRSSKIMRRLIRSICSNQPLGDLSSLDNPQALSDIRKALRVATT